MEDSWQVVDHSVVIPTWNHPDRLASCLASILDARSGSWEYEVLVMDNSDATYREANAAAVSSLGDSRVRYVAMTSVGLMAARHEGVEAARGGIVSFVDEDELLLPSWFKGVQACMRDPGVAVATGPFIPKYEAKPPSWLEYLWEADRNGRHLLSLTLFDGGDSERDIDPVWAFGGNVTIRKAVFEEVRGSHPDSMPPHLQALEGDGETGLMVKVRAAGYRARYSPDCAVLHAVPAERMTLESLLRRARYVGRGASFADARRENGMGAQQGVPAESAAGPRRSLLKRGVGRASRHLRAAAALGSGPPSTNGGPQKVAQDVRRQMAGAVQEGYAWHREQLAVMPGLREYVSRPDFIGNNALPPPACMLGLRDQRTRHVP